MPTTVRAILRQSAIRFHENLRYTFPSTHFLRETFQGVLMSSAKQKTAARHNVKKAVAAAKAKKTISHLSKSTRTALGKQGAKVAKERRAHA
jgi:hypothetical protein